MGWGVGEGEEESSARQATPHQKVFPRTQIPPSCSPIPPGDSEEVSGAQTTLEDAPTQKTPQIPAGQAPAFPQCSVGQTDGPEEEQGLALHRSVPAPGAVTCWNSFTASRGRLRSIICKRETQGPGSQCIENCKAATTGRKASTGSFEGRGPA